MRLRELTTIEEFGEVCRLEHEVWGYTTSEDAVPVPMLIVSVRIGGVLVGAFDPADRMVGFVYSLPALLPDGRPFQWSHMLAVADAYRDRGIAWQLKLEQRRLTLARGLNLIEWTYDPLQALNAHLNFSKLGVLVNDYEEDVYGASSSPLHRGTATDRFIAEWWLDSPRVEDRLDAVGRGHVAAFDASTVSIVNEVLPSGDWLAPGPHDLSRDEDRIGVVIPTGFTEMQQRDPALARAWRSATREIFEAYLPRGFQVVDFALDRQARRGVYALTRNPE